MPVRRGGEGDLDYCIVDRAHFERRLPRIDDPIPDHGIDLDRHVVLGDRLLLLNSCSINAQIHRLLPFDQRDYPVEAGATGSLVAPEPEDDGALVLIGNAQARQYDRQQYEDRQDRG